MNNRIKYPFVGALLVITSLKADFFSDSFEKMAKIMEAAHRNLEEELKEIRTTKPLVEVKLEENTISVEISGVASEKEIKVRSSAQEVEAIIDHEGTKKKVFIRLFDYSDKEHKRPIYILAVKAEAEEQKDKDEKNLSLNTQRIEYSLGYAVQLETVQSEYEKEKGILRLTFKLNVPEKRDVPIMVK